MNFHLSGFKFKSGPTYEIEIWFKEGQTDGLDAAFVKDYIKCCFHRVNLSFNLKLFCD